MSTSLSFRAYDSLPSGGGSLSSTTSTSMEETNVRLKELVKSLKDFVPEKAQKLLEEAQDIFNDGEDELRRSNKTEQVAINKRRKAHTRVLRLREALSTKQSQFAQFKDMMKQQLIKEQERFHKESEELKEAIRDAEERLQALEDGTADVQGPTEEMELEEILGDGPTESKLKQELEESKRSSEKAQHMFSTSQAQLKMYMDQCAQLRQMLDAKNKGQEVPDPGGAKVELSPMLPKDTHSATQADRDQATGRARQQEVQAGRDHGAALRFDDLSQTKAWKSWNEPWKE